MNALTRADGCLRYRSNEEFVALRFTVSRSVVSAVKSTPLTLGEQSQEIFIRQRTGLVVIIFTERFPPNRFEPGKKVGVTPRQEPNTFCRLNPFALVILCHRRRRMAVSQLAVKVARISSVASMPRWAAHQPK